MIFKKVLLTLSLLLLSGISLSAQTMPVPGERIFLVCQKIGGGEFNSPMPRGPIDPPSVSYDGYTLYINSSHPDCTVQLVDEEDIVVYEVFVDADTNVIIFPSTLTGEYRLNLLWDDWCFWGYIEL